MTIFVDTSALYGILDDTDPHHVRLADTLRTLVDQRLVTHNYVVVESATLVSRRLGSASTHRLLHDLLALVEVVWVDEPLHRAAVSAFLSAGTNQPSLVDVTSFEVMRSREIRTALAIDRDFTEAGFDLIPG